MSEHTAFLRKVYFFRDLADEDLRMIGERCRETSFKAGQIIFRERSVGDHFYIVLRGEIEVWKDFDLPSRDRLAAHGAGHIFGEMALVDDLPRSATVIARTDTTLLYLGREHFQEVLQQSTTVARSILRSLSAMVRQSNDSFVASLHRQHQELQRAYAELKDAQDELLRNERLSNVGKFSSMILHDLRNPISAIRGYAELILAHPTDQLRTEKYANSVMREADRLKDLSGELLDYSRGEIRLDMRLVDLAEFFSRFRSLVEDRFTARDMRIDVDVAWRDPVLLDERRLLRVFVNLADNARNAMERGGVLSVRVSEQAGNLLVEVSDTGRGMDAETLKRVFEPFYSSSGGGTGLGMVIVKNVIEAHDGSLSISSVPGGGTVVSILLPSG